MYTPAHPTIPVPHSIPANSPQTKDLYNFDIDMNSLSKLAMAVDEEPNYIAHDSLLDMANNLPRCHSLDF